MACFDTGVAGYIRAAATVRVNFPVDRRGNAAIACIHCPYLSSNQRMCQLNKEPVAYPEKYVGVNCPLDEIKAVDIDKFNKIVKSKGLSSYDLIIIFGALLLNYPKILQESEET